jgi:hypothetical protein
MVVASGVSTSSIGSGSSASGPGLPTLEICWLALELVAHVEPGLVAVAAVGVLHDELADADEAAAGSRLVAELRLEVVDHHWQLAIAADDAAEEVGDDLLVRHCEDHVASAAILEPEELGADLVVPAALLPQVRRVDDRHLHLLRPDPVHLLADDLLDPLADPESEGQQGVDPRAELAYVAGPHEQAMGLHLGVRRVVAERREEQLGKTHPRRIAGAPPRTCQPRPVTDPDHPGRVSASLSSSQRMA